MKNNIKATFLCCDVVFVTMYKLIPNKRYNIVQTGPNTALGGLKPGFTKVVYHVGICTEVIYPEMPPMLNGNSTQIKSLKTCLTFI